ncbi:MAG: ABC transporter permease [Acidobacteria bacterium]|nr:ABC transporter permease [Acidobacteriota bacterium]
MHTLLQDFRYGLRVLLKQPSFTLVAVITLALGIGANTAIFTVVNAVLLRPLPYQEPERIMALWPDRPGSSFQGVSPAKFVYWRAQSKFFEGIAATQGVGSGINLSGGNEPEFVSGVRVSADFFRVLGVNPAIGRGFTPEEDAPGGERVVMLSNALWQRRFNADPEIAGKTVSLNGDNYMVVGVLPEGFRYGDRTDLLIPMRTNPASRDEGHNLTVLARLKPGVTQAQARAEMKLVFEKFRAAYPNMPWRREQGIRVESYLASMTAQIRPMLLILLGAVGFVLLIACANVANLQLTRAAGRRKEMAIRTALGAGGWRIARQLMTEGVLLSLLGGAAGLLIALWGLEALLALMPEGLIPRSAEISFDWRVLAFALATALVNGLLFALAPAGMTLRLDVNTVLKDESGKGSSGSERGRLQSVLVVSEVALALVLLIGATLLLRTLANLRQVEPGFDPHNVLTFEVATNGERYDTTAEQADYFRRALERIKILPGVEAAAVTSNLPLSAWLNLGVGIAGKPDSLRSTEVRMVTADYFDVMKMAVRRGRLFTEADTASTEPVIIVNETYARTVFPGGDPIGQSLTIGDATICQIIGVVNDVKQFSLSDSAPATVFVPIAQVNDKVMRTARQFVTMKFAVRTKNDPLSLSAAVRHEMLKVDASLPLARVRSLEQIVSRSLASDRFNSLMLGLFAMIGMVLAAVGIYGVISYSVAQRTREIGVRMALGARRRDVLVLVIRQGMLLTSIGVVIGLAGAFALTRVMTRYLFGVSATDPITFAGVAALLAFVSLVACYIPARRATKVDPMVSLRYE